MLGSGTISGGVPGTRGCLLEATSGGKEPLILRPRGSSAAAGARQVPAEARAGAAAGEEGEVVVRRTWLEDGDEVVLRGFCQRDEGGEVVSFGECKGVILPSISR